MITVDRESVVSSINRNERNTFLYYLLPTTYYFPEE
jgi:hypothetical protein